MRTERILRAVKVADAIEQHLVNHTAHLAVSIEGKPAATLEDIIGVPHAEIETFEENVLTDIVAKIRLWEASL